MCVDFENILKPLRDYPFLFDNKIRISLNICLWSWNSISISSFALRESKALHRIIYISWEGKYYEMVILKYSSSFFFFIYKLYSNIERAKVRQKFLWISHSSTSCCPSNDLYTRNFNNFHSMKSDRTIRFASSSLASLTRSDNRI